MTNTRWKVSSSEGLRRVRVLPLPFTTPPAPVPAGNPPAPSPVPPAPVNRSKPHLEQKLPSRCVIFLQRDTIHGESARPSVLKAVNRALGACQRPGDQQLRGCCSGPSGGTASVRGMCTASSNASLLWLFYRKWVVSPRLVTALGTGMKGAGLWLGLNLKWTIPDGRCAALFLDVKTSK